MEEKSASPAHFGSLLSLDTHTTNPQHLRYHVQGSLTIRLRFRKAGLRVSYRRFKLQLQNQPLNTPTISCEAGKTSSR
jgi:hypothetical protein